MFNATAFRDLLCRAWLSVSLGLDGDQAVTSLPLLIRILSFGRIEEEVIVHGSMFEVAEVVIGGGAQEISDDGGRQQFVANIQSLNGQRVVLVLVCCNGQTAIGDSEVGLELDGGLEFLFRFGELALLQEYFAE